MPLDVTLGPVKLKNPILTGSGTFAFGETFADFFDLSILGGVIGKSVGLQPRLGNAPPRTAETASGMLNSIGLEGKGIEYFTAHTAKWLETLKTTRVVSIFGNTEEEYRTLCGRLADLSCFEVLELNLSCPNVKEGGLEFGHDPAAIGRIVGTARKTFNRPIWAKLSPNVTSIAPFAKAAEEAGADGLTLSNTFVGMAVHWRKRRTVLTRGTGGLSGPAIKPLALRAVWAAAKHTRLPIVASGGAYTADDVLEFLVAGASAVEIGTANFTDPMTCQRILADLERTLAAEKIADLGSLIGTLKLPEDRPPEAP